MRGAIGKREGCVGRKRQDAAGPGPVSCPLRCAAVIGTERQERAPVWSQLSVGRRDLPEITGVWKPSGPHLSKSRGRGPFWGGDN